MDHVTKNRIKKRLLILDLAVLIISLITSAFLRYHKIGLEPWQINFYSTILLEELLIYTLIFLYRYYAKNTNLINEQDPIDNLVSIVKNQSVLFLLLLVVLFATRNMTRASRLLLGYMFLLNIFLDVIGRFLYRRHLIRRLGQGKISHWILPLTTRALAPSVLRHLGRTLPAGSAVAAIVITDLEEGENASYSGMLASDYGFTASLRKESQSEPSFLRTYRLQDMIRTQMDSHKIHTDLEIHGELEAFLFLPQGQEEEIRGAAYYLAEAGVRAHLCLAQFDDILHGSQLTHVGDYLTMDLPTLTEKGRVLKTDYTVANVDTAVWYVKNHLDQLRGRYICFSNVHTTVMAHDHEDYKEVLDHAAFVFSDGNPIAHELRRIGHTGAGRVGGPDFMEAAFRATENTEISHYFYGSTQETIDQLQSVLPLKHPGLKIAGLESPPFRPLTQEEDEAAVQRINASGADIVWIGLGAPKQEKWMAAHEGRIHAVMMGVGAGFDFHAGTIKRAPRWIQKISLEWLYRLFQDPRRLLSRYLVTNTRFLIFLFLSHFRTK